jgi:hypothetical protein
MSANRIPQPVAFDWKRPDYMPILAARAERLRRIRKDPAILTPLFDFYRANPAQFICDFGTTYDPRNPERDYQQSYHSCCSPSNANSSTG